MDDFDFKQLADQEAAVRGMADKLRIHYFPDYGPRPLTGITVNFETIMLRDMVKIMPDLLTQCSEGLMYCITKLEGEHLTPEEKKRTLRVSEELVAISLYLFFPITQALAYYKEFGPKCTLSLSPWEATRFTRFLNESIVNYTAYIEEDLPRPKIDSTTALLVQRRIKVVYNVP